MNAKTKLPDLPRQLDRREAAFGLQLRKWIDENPQITCVFEIKRTPTNSIPFSCLEDKQISHLYCVKHDPKGVLIRVDGTKGEPDYAYYKNEPAWVVIRYPRSFHVIDIDCFLLERKRSKRKSLTSARAREISTYSVNL